MSKIVLVYASMTGNTEKIATILANALLAKGLQVDQVEMDEYDPTKLRDYEGIIIGSCTWGDGGLPFEADDFYETLGDVDLSGKVAAVFGSGDPIYPEFCEAVHTFERKLVECGAELISNGLKIEFAPETEEDVEACEKFVDPFLSSKTGGNGVIK